MYRVSIIVPVYNARNYIERCIDSLVHQTYDNYEIIIIDDGSTDGSADICDKYALEDTRIRVIHKKMVVLRKLETTLLNRQKVSILLS